MLRPPALSPPALSPPAFRPPALSPEAGLIQATPTPQPRELALAARHLSKRYGAVEAVRGVSFEVGRGEIFALLGPNGAGKSTTIKMLCTLARPSGGTASVGGF